jgi:PST family polysaccharide transporter
MSEPLSSSKRVVSAHWRKLEQQLRSVSDNPHIRPIIGNASWLVADRVVRMSVNVGLTVMIARYLGARQFGEFNYAWAFVSLFSSLATFGLDSVVVRDLVSVPAQAQVTLGTAFAIRLCGGLLAFVAAGAGVAVARPGERLLLELTLVMGAAAVFQSADVFDFWFQSRVRSKNSVYARNLAFLISASLRAILVWERAPLIYFACCVFLEAFLASVGLLTVYRRAGQRVGTWRVQMRRCGELLHLGWPLMLSGLAIMIYMKIDVVMIGSLLGDRATGIYTAATRISEIWYFVPAAIVTSVAPSIAAAKTTNDKVYYARLERLFRWLTLFALFVALAMTVGSSALVRLLFGRDYQAAGPILAVHIWAGLFVSLGVAQGLWDVNECLVRLALFRTATGAAANVALNMLLLPRLGPMGAAVATVISYAVSAFFLNALHPRTRRIFRLQLRALLVAPQKP